jgi:triacylglycerol lipase
MGRRVEQTLAVLNGLIGDYLARTQNGLATDMTVRRAGALVPLTRSALAAAFPNAPSRIVVLVHGLMVTEDVWRLPDGTDYGSLLEHDLGFGALYVRYNSGRSLADNGAQLSQLLEQLLKSYPGNLEELLLVGYSMGGLLIRSACHVAREVVPASAWLTRVRRIVYVGTPHLGAPAERVGKLTASVLHWIPNAYTRLIGDIGDLRSAGIKDIGHADLRAEDQALVRSPWALRAAEHPVPLLPEIAHYLIAGSMFADPRLALLFGDSLVPVISATFGASALEGLIPADRVKVLPKLNHIALAHHPEVYAALRSICEETS